MEKGEAGSHDESKGKAEFVLRKDRSILLILHASKDDERKQLADLDGTGVRMKFVQHYANEIWLTFLNDPE
jgi:hypothetical protein